MDAPAKMDEIVQELSDDICDILISYPRNNIIYDMNTKCIDDLGLTRKLLYLRIEK
jgi:hypothetical protein